MKDELKKMKKKRSSGSAYVFNNKSNTCSISAIAANIAANPEMRFGSMGRQVALKRTKGGGKCHVSRACRTYP